LQGTRTRQKDKPGRYEGVEQRGERVDEANDTDGPPAGRTG
jgi:hypothetical protein